VRTEQVPAWAPEIAVLTGGPAWEPRTLMDILRQTIAAYPAAPALEDDHGCLTYGQLGERIDAFARELWAVGIGAGDRVGVRVPSGSVELYVAILGVLASGAAYVPVDAEEPDDRAETVWSEAGVCAVVGARLGISVVKGVRMLGNSPQAHPNDDAWIIFTSGSTGKPKGVAISHRSAAAWADAESELFCASAPLGPGDRVLAGLSVAFDASCEEMWLAWRSGACLVPAPRSVVRSGEDLGPWLSQRRITVVSTVPTLAALWPAEALERVRLLIFGGEACPNELILRLAGPTREVWNTYGPTEATVIACGAQLDGVGPVRIGLALQGYELAVVDASGSPVRWGEEGELIIGGVGLGRYLDPAKDAEKYAAMPGLGWDRAYRSGDLVLADREGLIFVGRADEQVKLAGRRVELGEIDEALCTIDGVATAAAAVQTSASGNKVLAGYLVPEPGATLDLGAARRWLETKLPRQLVPALGVVEELPVKVSGKVDRKALPWPMPAGVEDQSGVGALHGEAEWLANQWISLLGPLPLTEDSDFFAVGGASMAAAQLVSALRVRFPEVSIADVYAHPILGQMARHLEGLGADGAKERAVQPTPWWTALVQAPVIGMLYGITGLRYVTGILVVCLVLYHVAGEPWVPNPPLLATLGAWVVLYSLPFRMLAAVLAVRALMFRVGPGLYARGGSTHLRLWTAERILTYGKLEPIMGTPLGPVFARALGCKVGKDVHLDALPPVTGLATFDDGATIEHEADLAGHWLDGDVLHIGSLRIGAQARVGARSTLLGGADVGAGAEIAPGSSVDAAVPAGELWEGSQIEYIGPAGRDWPEQAHHAPLGRGRGLLYALSLGGLTLLPILSVIPAALLMLVALRGVVTLEAALWTLVPWSPVFIVVTLAVYLAATAGLVRLLGRAMTPGFHPLNGTAAWATWLTQALMSKSLVSTYPIYASLLTPAWMRALGAKVGRHVEISTVETLPHLTSFADRSFMADHSRASAQRARAGWLHLGHASVGEKSFLGNSAIMGPDRHVPDNSLIAVLSSVPAEMPDASNWFGRPPVELPRPMDNTDSARTYNPPRKLVLARAAVEACRIMPAVIVAWMALATVAVLNAVYEADGFLAVVLWSGPVMLLASIAAAFVALAAKWALVGRFTAEEHPLWSSFVWRNELADVFSESLAVPGLVRMSVGTPMINVWMRCMGARMGHGVWCETWWLPEFDLVSIGENVSINRGTVLQTHLFHDRIMRLDGVRMEAGSTLGPNSIALPGSTIGSQAVVGAASLVMRSENVPAGSSWAGNPIRSWTPVRTRKQQRYMERAEATAAERAESANAEADHRNQGLWSLEK